MSDVEPTGLADPMGFVKEKEGLSGVRVPLPGAWRMKCGQWRQEKQVCREGKNERLCFVMCLRVLGGHQGCVGARQQRSGPRSC